MDELHQKLVLYVQNTFLHVKDMSSEARMMRRSHSDSSLSSSSVRQEPMVVVGKGHWVSADQERQPQIVAAGSVSDSSATSRQLDQRHADGRRDGSSGAASSSDWSPGNNSPAKESAAAGSTDTVSQDVDGTEADEDEVEQQQSSCTLARRKSWSIGSALHNAGKCRPCGWNWKTLGCSEGGSCVRCHLCGDDAFKMYRKDRLKGLKAKRSQKRERKMALAAAAPGPHRAET